jgi:hypothetical protein
MDQMDRELASSSMGQSFEKVKRNKPKGKVKCVLNINSEVPFCMLTISYHAVVLESKYSMLPILKVCYDPVLVSSPSQCV